MVGRRPIPRDTRLAQWLRLTGRTYTGFAAEAGTTVQNISRICKGDEPGKDLAKLIVAATKNAVTFEDLYAAPSSESAA